MFLIKYSPLAEQCWIPDCRRVKNKKDVGVSMVRRVVEKVVSLEKARSPKVDSAISVDYSISFFVSFFYSSIDMYS